MLSAKTIRYRYKTQPRNFQRRALKKAIEQERLALWMPMRSGKTKVAVDYACVQFLKHRVRRVLVLTHSPTTFGVWRDEWAKHAPVDYELCIQQPLFSEGRHLQVLVLNIQRVYDRERHGSSWTPVRNEALYDWKPEVLIVDESTCIGDPSALQTAHTYRLVKQLGIRFILELTGTPVHRKIWGAFGQFKVLDDQVFGTSITAYRQQYGIWGGYGGRVLLRLRNVRGWRRKVEPHIFQMHRIPYRPPVEQVIPVELSDRTRRIYDRMEREAMASVNGQAVMAPIVLTRVLKCCQIAAGWLRDEDGEWHRIGDDLYEAYRDLMEQLYSSEVSRVVVFARHLPEVRDARRGAKAAGYKTLLLHGGMGADAREQRISRFHDRGGKIAFISQIATGSMGIDLSAADTAVYYTLTESLLHKDQADARIRKHQDKRPLTYYYLLPRGTHLETMYRALAAKLDLADYVAKHPALVHFRERG